MESLNLFCKSWISNIDDNLNFCYLLTQGWQICQNKVQSKTIETIYFCIVPIILSTPLPHLQLLNFTVDLINLCLLAYLESRTMAVEPFSSLVLKQCPGTAPAMRYKMVTILLINPLTALCIYMLFSKFTHFLTRGRVRK